MKSLFALTLLAMSCFSGSVIRAEDKSAPKKQLMIRVAILEGDPLGSRKAGTLRCLAEPVMSWIEGHPVNFALGDKVALPGEKATVGEPARIGLEIAMTTEPIKDGNVRIDLKVSRTNASERTNERVYLQSESTRIVETVTLGEVMKARLRQGTPEKQLWIEYTIEEVKPTEVNATR